MTIIIIVLIGHDLFHGPEFHELYLIGRMESLAYRLEPFREWFIVLD